MQSNEIRQTFLEFFQCKGHTRRPSASLVPKQDPSLLFVNAGMVPFKDRFLGGPDKLDRLVCSSQKCLRVSGKHNDLEEVGPSPRHHTFFEMLGNFSFGEYFKREAIQYAWELLTEVYCIPVERLWITVHTGDDEAEQLWREIGVEPSRILRFGDKENFWMMGETGPCGPSSEIHYYHGDDLSMQRPEGVNSEDDTYMELWNLVFVQYYRDEQGMLHPLDRPSVDTGMGLERLCSVLQGVGNDYQTDLFQPLLQRLIRDTSPEQYRERQAYYHTIMDHCRSIAFLIADGVRPSNTRHGYVLRRLIRRAIYIGRELGLPRSFLGELVLTVIETMGSIFPELIEHSQEILDWTTDEETRFLRTLEKGVRYLEDVMNSLHERGEHTLSGAEVFRLHDTYGFPPDLTQRVLSRSGLKVDMQGYERCRQEQQERSRRAIIRSGS
ncbi:alanyl-tRNA synthetase [Thermosporothrix hazakensis]|jgi:alanyl-tRNA synthetase|uniref:Alanine--tRNA ligase n=2 Tax=Thermosporothrix TaxID=768650 RepID=A0A326UH64_THEHA|nr:alanine--tRNA ligase [Thermosporothrix hazakensis]PZW36270.1 alanyl-tRNA synthetase [Thermosporothrix hazakensis]BBH88735.1 hypothetical protein KTC_34860 [Thermosporothrix sp. COM3]GCE46919.1 hypothetical protein KTH_17880 [Thermosporothrix hazakensis]